MAVKRKPKKSAQTLGRTIKVYNSYRFVDKDPIIDQIRTIVADSGETYKQIHEDSGVSTATMHNWFLGGTKRPQFASVNAIARALGHELVFVPIKKKR